MSVDWNFKRMEAAWLEPPEAEVYTHCDCCGEPIYEGEEYYSINGWEICEECIGSYRRMAGE